MLQPAAPSAQSILALAQGGQPAAAENAAIPDSFAALLASGLAIENGIATTSAGLQAAAPSESEAVIASAGKGSGKAPGNILPVLLPDGKVLPAQFDTDTANLAETDVEAPVGQAPLDPSLAALVLVQAVATATPQAPAGGAKPDQTATTARLVTPAQCGEALAQLKASAAPATAYATPTVVAEPAKATAEAPRMKLPSQGNPATAAEAIVEPALAPPVDQSVRPVTLAIPTVKPAADFRAIPTPLSASALLPDEAAAVAVQPASPLAATDAGKAAIQVSLTLPAGGTAAARRTKAEPSAAPVAGTPQPAVAAPRSEMPAALQPQPVTETVAARAASAAPAAMPTPTSADTRSETAQTRVAPPVAELAAPDLARPAAAAELQPILAFRDAQPLTAAAGAPVTVPATSVQPQGHDFATLVDRLVEARDAAMPQAVKAAIHHADFGQVSLNFQTDDNRLTVSMTSADPGFAPAVQAAAAMQANTSTDSGASNQRQEARQDSASQQQQQTASASGNGQPQAQTQAQSQGSARGGERERTDLGRQAGGQDAQSESTQSRNDGQRGIYA